MDCHTGMSNEEKTLAEQPRTPKASTTKTMRPLSARFKVYIVLALILGLVAICTVSDDDIPLTPELLEAERESLEEGRDQDAVSDFSCSKQPEADNLKEEEIAAATKHLHSEIVDLSSKLEDANALYSSLGAEKIATERSLKEQINSLQTRLTEVEVRHANLETEKGTLEKSLNDQLMSLQSRLVESLAHREALDADKAEVESTFQEQIDSLKGLLEEAQERYVSLNTEKIDMEKSLKEHVASIEERLQSSEMRALEKAQIAEVALSKEKEAASVLRKDSKKLSNESKMLEQQMKNLFAENKVLSSDLKERSEDLSMIKNKYFDVRQELFNANERLREIERKYKESIFKIIWVRLKSTKEVAFIVGKVEPYWTSFTQQMVVPLRAKVVSFLKDSVSPWLSGVKNYADEVSQTYSPTVPPVREIEVLKPLTAAQAVRTSAEYRQGVLDAVDDWLKRASSVVSSYCMLQYGSETSGWLYTGSQYVNTNSEKIAHWVELALIILVSDFIFRNFLSWLKKPQRDSFSTPSKVASEKKI